MVTFGGRQNRGEATREETHSLQIYMVFIDLTLKTSRYIICL